MIPKLKKIEVISQGSEDSDDINYYGALYELSIEVEGTLHQYSLFICTPEWLVVECADGPVFGQYRLVLDSFNLEKVEAKISRYCTRCAGKNSALVFQRLSRFFRSTEPFVFRT